MAIESTRKEAPHASSGRAWHGEAGGGRSSGSVSRAQAPRLKVSAHEMPLSNIKKASSRLRRALSRSKDSMAIESTRKEAPHASSGRAWQAEEALRGVPYPNSLPNEERSKFARKHGTEGRARRGSKQWKREPAQAPRLKVSAHEMPLSNIKKASRVRPGTLQVEGLHGNRKQGTHLARAARQEEVEAVEA